MPKKIEPLSLLVPKGEGDTVKQFRGSGYHNFLGDRYPNHESYRAEILREYSPTNTGHMPGVMCHLSRVRCQVSSVTCQVSGVILFYLFFELGQLVGGGSVINGAYPV